MIHRMGKLYRMNYQGERRDHLNNLGGVPLDEIAMGDDLVEIKSNAYKKISGFPIKTRQSLPCVELNNPIL